MSLPAEIPFQQLVDALLNEKKPLHPRYLYRLSDLEEADLTQLAQIWSRVPVWRRQALMEDLENIGETDDLLSFLEVGRLALSDSDSKVRLLAVRILMDYEDASLLPTFLEMVEVDSDAEVRAASALALGPFIYQGEVEELPQKTLRKLEDSLLRVLNSSDKKNVRRRALEALGFSSRAELIPLIEWAYNAGDQEWLISSLFSMGRSANRRWQPQVLAMLDHTDPLVRAEAATAAGELEVADASPRLLELLSDPDDDVCMASIWALSQIGGEGVREALEQLQEDTEDDEIVELIESALDNLSFTEDFDLFSLMDIPEDDESEVEDFFYYTDDEGEEDDED
jgi:HEAT repeat protein